MRRLCLRHLASSIALAAAFGFAPAAPAQGYPARPIRLIIDFPVGGPSDVLARTFAQKLTDALGQQVVSDNRPGASGALAYGLAAKAPADGYTLVWLSTPFPLNAALRGKLPYDTFADFTPISLVATYDNVLIVHAGVPAKSVQEFISYAKSKPGGLTYASSGSGSVQHLAMESFRRLAGFQAVHVPYAGSAPALLDLVAARVDGSITLPPAAMPHVKAGRLRVLAAGGAKRLSALPDIPTLTESGYPVIADGWGGIAGPRGVPTRIVQRIDGEIARAVKMRDVRDRIEAFGGEPVHAGPGEFAKFIRTQYDRWGPVIKQAGVKLGD
ncbi:MAG TPA: tripartite tricarboxylate transporter substrate binding protein [Burkholderiales bacterium]|nr:tripartite tricarboxylate transporter substrate binding protein [Burkholderiales bacterium]